MTAAYKKKLEEDRKWQEEEKLREAVEAAQDVRKKGHMGDFYRQTRTPDGSRTSFFPKLTFRRCLPAVTQRIYKSYTL